MFVLSVLYLTDIPPILLAESLAYTFLIIAVFICAIELKTLHLFHCTYRLFALSVMVQWIGTIVQGVAWAKYGLTGLGPHTTLGGLFVGASEVIYLLLILLMAKGYTITRARISSSSTIKLTIFINIYIVAYISLFIFQANVSDILFKIKTYLTIQHFQQAFDPGEVLNLYESPAGFGLAGLRLGAWFGFMISTVTTIKKYPEKSSFFYPFGLLGSLWMLGGPIATLFGIGVLDPWVRESMMYAVLGIVAFSGHAAFLVIN